MSGTRPCNPHRATGFRYSSSQCQGINPLPSLVQPPNPITTNVPDIGCDSRFVPFIIEVVHLWGSFSHRRAHQVQKESVSRGCVAGAWNLCGQHHAFNCRQQNPGFAGGELPSWFATPKMCLEEEAMEIGPWQCTCL